ncbi:MAG: methionyl-tRNA formyltransferase [Bacteroidales bacterium]|nr:methionyl-tRNA formyltransferase [Bacteroidales bacterium]MDY5119594.1 methionyl-tRNA formyltransferase [Muribaculaceae bacterium]
MNKESLRIVFLGTPEFAVESLDALVSGGYNIVGVVTMPDKIGGRGHKVIESPVKQYAVAHGLKLMQPANLKEPEFVEELRSLNADLQIVIAFRMLPEIVWSMPPMGTFNLHASLLPKYRGAAPINRAVMNGETETGVTTFFLKHEIDTGDIIQQVAVPIEIDDDVETVYDRLMHLGASLVLETVEAILAGTVKPIEQEKLLTTGEEPTPAPKIFKEDCRIDWTKTSWEVYNHIRGLSPYPAAWSAFVDAQGTEYQFKVFKTSHPEKFQSSPVAPGTIEYTKHTIKIACADGFIEILSLQLAGKKRMSSDEFLRGFNLEDKKLS